MARISEICGKMPKKTELNIIMDIASGYTMPEIMKKYNISLTKYNNIKRAPINRFIINERKRAIKQTVYRVFGKFDCDYELMVQKYMERLLEDERIDKTSLMALASIVDTFSNIYKKVAEIDTMSKKQLLDLRRYKLEKQHYEILRKMKLGNEAVEDGGTPNSIIAEFYSKLNEMATEDFKQKDIDITNEMKQMQEIDLSNKTEGELNEIRAMINKQLKILGEKKPDGHVKEEHAKKKEGGDKQRAHAMELKRNALKKGITEQKLVSEDEKIE